MDEFLKSIKAWLYDRTSNPLFFVFVLSWIFWNYKLFVVAFSDGDLWVKLTSLDELYSDRSQKWCYMAWLPVATTAFTVIVYPIFSNLTFLLHKWYENLFADIKLKLENKTPVDREQYRLLRGELVALQENAAEIESKKNSEITELRKTIATLQGKISPAQKIYPNQDLDNIDRKIILMLKNKFDNRQSDVGKSTFENEIEAETKRSPIEIDVSLKRLVNRNLLGLYGNDLKGMYYSLTDEGNNFAIELSNNNKIIEGEIVPITAPTKEEMYRQRWIKEFSELDSNQQAKFRIALQDCLEKIANSNMTIAVENIAFGIGKGLVEHDGNGNLKLTEKGRVIAEVYL